jgi:hypothetical protein
MTTKFKTIRQVVMLGRKKTSKAGKPLPLEWIEGLSRLLNETYKVECKQNGRYFDVYGKSFSEEFLVIASYMSEKDEYLAPISLFLSSDPDQFANEERLKETQKNFIDIIGLFFDEIFADQEWDNINPTWQEVTHKSQNYFYKISRENINATLEADRLLGDDFMDIGQEEDLDQ